MSSDATNLIKLAARHGYLQAEVARAYIDKVRSAADPDRLAEHLLVQAGHCSPVQVERLRTELSVLSEIPPTTIAGYRLIDRLGSGGMGEVYRAEQISMQRVVALKLLNNELLKDDIFGQRFLREARAAGQIHHPNVVLCYDTGVANGRYYMALEYVSGGDAERLMRTYDHRLGEMRALEIARDCARGLEALHAADFIHRDIKPSNILLTEDGIAKIGDLGLVATASPDQKLTQSGAALGTPAYMSPEQADGAPNLDVRTDVYSLGATIFYLLTGHPPYTGQSAWAVVAKVINDPFPDPRRLMPEISAGCADLVLKATAKDRIQRFANMTEMRRALDALLANGDQSSNKTAIEPPKKGDTTRTQATLQPTPRSVPQLVPQSTSKSPAQPTPQSRSTWPAWIISAAAAAIVLIVALQLVLIINPSSTTVPAVITSSSNSPTSSPSVSSETDKLSVAQTNSEPPTALPATKTDTAAVREKTAADTDNTTKPITEIATTTKPEQTKSWLDRPESTSVPPPSTLVSEPTPSSKPMPPVSIGEETVPPSQAAVITPAPVVHQPRTETTEKTVPVVAVLGCEAGDYSLTDFAKAFPELLTVALTKKGNFDLVERTQLRKVLNEQELTQSGMIDSANAARIGALIGARVLITQRVYKVGDYLYVSAKAIDVETGRVKAVSKGELSRSAAPAGMSTQIAADLGRAIDSLSGAVTTDSAEVSALLTKLVAAVRGKRLPTVVIAVDEAHNKQSAPDPAVRTEFGYLLRKSGFRVIESDNPALAIWAKDYAAGRTSPFPADLGAVDVVIAGSGTSEGVGTIGQLRSARARLEVSAIAVKDGQILAVERATTSGADASDLLAGKLALEKGVRQLALSFITDMTAAWNAR